MTDEEQRSNYQLILDTIEADRQALMDFADCLRMDRQFLLNLLEAAEGHNKVRWQEYGF
jgi:hypothetical protein